MSAPWQERMAEQIASAPDGSVLVNIPPQQAHGGPACNARACSHRPWGRTPHCAEMACFNYVNKCREHGVSLPAPPSAEPIRLSRCVCPDACHDGVSVTYCACPDH